MQLTKINNKWDIWLPDHRAARPEWPHWEEKRLASIHETTKPGDIVYYVGAEEGDMCALLATWGAKLVMFEPNGRVWPNIRAIWEANKLDPDTTFYSCFLSDMNTGKALPGVVGGIQGEVIPDHGFKELRDPGEISQIRLDEIVNATGNIPDMISIDTEGSEGRILRGAERTLKEHHPRIYLSLHPEFIHEQYGEWGAELRRWIMDLGYSETLLDYPLHEVHLKYEAN